MDWVRLCLNCLAEEEAEAARSGSGILASNNELPDSADDVFKLCHLDDVSTVESVLHTSPAQAQAPPRFRAGAASWVGDDEVERCMCCGGDFSYLIRRKHHCRICGGVVCSDCSAHRAEVWSCLRCHSCIEECSEYLLRIDQGCGLTLVIFFRW